ncbi:hypothetical protein ACFOZY_10795 [Chungangia koreensis]|uniref:DUF2283 domain-containing protein n=1 Tax=Chungangia koreensis TaxID=752657 RepID=A0ABV8X7D0_9LACT
MTTNNTLTSLHTLEQYNNCDITLTFKDQHNLPFLDVCYVHRQFKINNFREANSLIFEDIDSTLYAIERAFLQDQNTPPK